MCAATQVSGADAMSNGGSERKLIGKWRSDFVANAGDPSLSASQAHHQIISSSRLNVCLWPILLQKAVEGLLGQ